MFSAEYLLKFLKSEHGRGEINRRSHGAVRRRLYFEDMEAVEVPIPEAREAWEAVLQALASARRYLRNLPTLGAAALSSLEQAVFADAGESAVEAEHRD